MSQDREMATKPNSKPWKFDEIRRARFLGLLRKGYSRSGAAAGVGVNRKTVQRAIRAARFARQVEEAERKAIGEVEAALFKKAKGGHFPSISYYLGNRAVERWRTTSKIEVSEGQGRPITYDDVVLIAEEHGRRVAAALGIDLRRQGIDFNTGVILTYAEEVKRRKAESNGDVWPDRDGTDGSHPSPT